MPSKLGADYVATGPLRSSRKRRKKWCHSYVGGIDNKQRIQNLFFESIITRTIG